MNHFIDDHEPARKAPCLPKRSPSISTHGSKQSSSYSKLLEVPTSIIAGNVPERADATDAAILGYN